MVGTSPSAAVGGGVLFFTIVLYVLNDVKNLPGYLVHTKIAAIFAARRISTQR